MVSKSALEIAMEFARRGWYVFPVQPNGKHPYKDFKWKELSTKDPEKVRAAGEHPKYSGCNWALDTGMSGLLIADIDVKPEKNGFNTLHALGKTLEAELIVETPSSGNHYYYEDIGPSTAGKLGLGIDTRGIGGYVLIPGSKLPYGEYKILHDTGKALTKAPCWIKDALGAIPEKRADRNDAACELDTEVNIQQTVNYLQNSAPEAVEGDGGDAATYQVACRCRDLGLSEDKTLQLMSEHWNPIKAHPPWDDIDLARKVANAYRYSRDRAGNASPAAMFKDGKPVALMTGHTAAGLLAKIIPPQRWLVDSLLPTGGLGILAGRPKLGKSWLALQLCIAICEAEDFLGFPTNQAPVAYLALEDGLRRLQGRLGKMLNGKSAPEGLLFFNEWLPLDHGGLEDFANIIEEHRLKLIVLDTWQRVRPLVKPKGASAYEVDYAEAGKLKTIADKYDCLLLIVHHLRKTIPGMGGDIFEKVNGSSGITGAADVLMVLDRCRNVADAELHASGRDIQEGVHLLSQDKETMTWKRVGGAEGIARTPEQQNLLKAVKELGEATPARLAELTGFEIQYIKNALPKLLRQGLLKRVKHGSYATLNLFDEESVHDPLAL